MYGVSYNLCDINTHFSLVFSAFFAAAMIALAPYQNSHRFLKIHISVFVLRYAVFFLLP